MKILLVSVKSEKTRGGIAVWTDRFIEQLERKNIKYDIVNTEVIGKRGENGTAGRNIFDEVKRTCRIFRDLRRNLKNNDYTVAHLNTSCGTFGLFRDYVTAKKIKKKGIRVVAHFHCDIPFWIKSKRSEKCLRKLLSVSDESFVLCENSRKYLEEHFGVSSVKIPNFVDADVIRKDEKTIGSVIEKAVFVGRVCRAKGSFEIFELARRFPDITFELVGDIGEGAAALEKPENVLLTGGKPHSEVLSRMDEADVFIFPSYSEGFSLALTEAMARALPSIATDVGAARDMLEPSCGVVVPPRNVDALEAAIASMASPEVRFKISENARRKVKEEYSADAVVAKIVSYYNEMNR